jgi:hypothetical protein
VALASLVIVAVYAWSGRFWVDLIDEGYFLDLSQRVLDGALPYRDFTTYYTPGIFYLFALVFKLFGTNILPVRFLMAILRGLCALLLYLLTRRVAPRPLAWLPFVIVAALDHWPVEPEPHPSWPSIVACLLTLELVAQHLESGRRRWLALAGVTAGLAYLFKQNIGAFTALGLAAYVVLRPLPHHGAARRSVQVLFAVATAVAVTLLMWSNMDALAAAALWLPILVTLGLLTFSALRGDQEAAAGCIAIDASLAAAGFGAVSLSWLVPLLAAIGPASTPLGLFVGSIDQAAIATRFAGFTAGIPPVFLASIWLSTILLVSRRCAPRRPLFLATGLSLAVLALPAWTGPRDRLTDDPQLLPLLTWLDESFGTFHLYLPSLATWAGIAGLAFGPRSKGGPYPWYVLFGALAALTMYPRADTLHAIVSSPVALIGATGALALLSHSLRGEAVWRRVGALAPLLLVTLTALVPQMMWRVAVIVPPDERLDYADLALPRAPVRLPRKMAEDIHGAVTFIQSGTSPGEPFFVYPVAPLFNFLADRPNPTRFDHFLPGTLSAADFDEVITELEHARPRYILWDHLGVVMWETDRANRPLSDYIWRCYDEVAAFRLYLVLERRC